MPKTLPVQSQEIKLVALDLDGTLLRSDKSVSPASVLAMKKVFDAGIRLVVATARSTRDTFPLIRKLGVFSYLIACNGSLILDAASGLTLAHYSIDSYLARRAVELVRASGASNVVVEAGNRWAVDVMDDSVTAWAAAGTGEPLVQGVDRLLADPVSKLLVRGNSRLLQAAVQKEFGDQLTVVVSDRSNWFEVLSPEASKGNALRFLANALDISPMNILSFGDEENDVSMFDCSGIAVAMGNATSFVQGKAHQVTKTNDEDGVAAFLHQAFCLE